MIERWRSILPYLAAPLPPDRAPAADGGAVSVNLPMQLARQSLQQREYWDIPDEVLQQYRRYRPTPLWRAAGFERAVGARRPIWVKYEGGNISGSHKLNTALAQAHYYSKAGVRELVTGTGAGQWGTALAAACARFGLRCTVFMVGDSLRDKPYRGVLMRMHGAEVHASPSGLTGLGQAQGGATHGNSLALAIGEAVEHAAGDPTRAFAIGSGETYSILHQSVIGLEAEEQLAAAGADIDAVVGCVGAGSNFGGVALPFLATARSAGTPAPLLLAVESSATPKLTRGVYAYDRTDATGTGPLEAMYTIGSECRISESHAAGLRYHGVAKVLSALRAAGDVAATAVGQSTALQSGREFTLSEGILPAPESGHALAAAAQLARGEAVADGAAEHRSARGVLVCLSGHGYLDLAAYEQQMTGGLTDSTPADEELRAATAGLSTVELMGMRP